MVSLPAQFQKLGMFVHKISVLSLFLLFRRYEGKKVIIRNYQYF